MTDDNVRPLNHIHHRLKRLGIDTYREFVIYMNRDCDVCRAEGFEVHSRIAVGLNGRSIVATLNVTGGDLLATYEAGLSEAAWMALAAEEGQIDLAAMRVSGQGDGEPVRHRHEDIRVRLYLKATSERRSMAAH